MFNQTKYWLNVSSIKAFSCRNPFHGNGLRCLDLIIVSHTSLAAKGDKVAKTKYEHKEEGPGLREACQATSQAVSLH